ncbi:MAG: hypothetical protein M1828_002253 [Chrysothrix sp. TS-e1954]|nr:MAG: hypothetical protein M1828_002253 [Chrysothrix sp. TS-e1954]
MPPVGGQRYLPSTAVLLAEIVKLSVSLTMALYDITAKHPNLPATTLFTKLMTSMFALDGWKLAFPALLGVLHNTCRYLALSNLDPISFLVTYQVKIVLAAVFGLIFLRKALDTRKSMSLLLLLLGILVIQVPQGPKSLERLREGSGTSYLWPRSLEELGNLGSDAAQQLTKRVAKRSATYQGIEEDAALHHPQLDAGLGLIAVTAASILSAASGTYLEGVLRETSSDQELIGGKFGTGAWIRNVQLSFFSIIAATVGGILYKDGFQISRRGFFAGYDVTVWATIFVQAFGSIAIAAVINYSKDVDRHLASCLSIFISFLGSLVLFDIELCFTVRTRLGPIFYACANG